MVVLCPGGIVSGSVGPETLKPAPETASWLMVTFRLPLTVNVTALVEVDPTVVLPKSRAVELEVS